MIKLDVADYCQECQAFEPVVDDEMHGNYIDAFGEPAYGVYRTHDKTVRCERASFCKRLVWYLRKNAGKDTNE